MSEGVAPLLGPVLLPHAGGGKLQLETIAKSTGFRTDIRFSLTPVPPPQSAPQDPLTVAWSEGFAVGAQQARVEAAEQAGIEGEAREALTLAFTRLDAELAEILRQRLHDTVAALCETALAPLALDETALMRRIERAVTMFARADDERVIRLNPEDLALVSAQFRDDWQVVPDPALERGALRVESDSGGVEDGPAQWRMELAEALQQC